MMAISVEEEVVDEALLDSSPNEAQTVENKVDQYIKVTVSSELTADDNEDSNFLLQLSILGRSWKVHRNEKKFEDISRRLSDSGLAAPPLSDGSIVSAQSLGNFLQRVLIDHYDKIWFCPHMMSFIDDEKLSEVEDMRVKSLTKQFSEVSNNASLAQVKLQDAWRMIATLAQRVRTLEASHQRIHNSFKPKEEGNAVASEPPLLAGIYRFEDVMSQAAEILKDETDWMPGDEGGFGSVALSEAVPIVIPDPPPVIHTYTTCTLLPFDIIPTNEEEDARDVAIGSVITLLEPHQAQITYRNSVKAFLARVVRRTLGAKVYETGLHALNCFLPDDPIRLTVLLGRTNVYIDTWLPALTEKLSILADIGCDNGKFLLAEMMQPLEDDCNAIEDIQPLTEHTVSHVHVTSGNLPRQGRIFSDIEDTNVEIDSNSLSSVRFLSFLDEIANLVGKNELFKRSLLLIRGWWLYETATYGGGSTKTLLTDQSLCVLVCSIFNQHHAILHQPLQVLSIFLSEYCELDWNNCAVTVQGIVPFRPVVNKSDADLLSVSVTDLESSSETSAQLTSQVTVEITEPWLRYPVETDLLSVAFLQKYAEVVKSTKPSAAAKSPAASGLMLISPMSSCKDTDIFTMNSMGMHSTDSMNDMSNSSTANPSASISRAGSSDSSAFYQLGSLHSDGPDSPMRRTASNLVIEEAPLFERGAINIVNPLNQSNMTVSAITSEKASVITQIFEIGARNLNQALKLSQGEHINVQAPFNRFFRAVLLRFRDNWRPDVFKGSQSMCQYAGDSSYTDDAINSLQALGEPTKMLKPSSSNIPETIWNQVCYMDLVLTGCVSESAVLALSKEILYERGTLPVGEIGKVLQELTCASSFLGKLKEKFGGLKKFLERFPDEFMICADHPFNPHVFVKKLFTADELDMVSKGIVPAHLTAKFKKAQRNKKTKSAVAGSQSVSPSLTYRTLHSQGSVNNLLSAANQGGYNSSAPGSAILGYRSSPVAISSHLANRGGGMGPNGTPGTSFSQMQQHQQQQNQFYGVVKAHQGSQYATPSVSSRNRASQSQSILRGAASYSVGNSLGNNGPYHQSSTPHTGFQSNYSLDGQNGNTRGVGPAGGSSGVNYPGVSTSRERERDGYGAPMRSTSGIGASMAVSDRDRNLDSYGSDRDSMFGLNQGGGGGITGPGQGGSTVLRSGSLMGGGGSRSLSLSSPMGSGSSQPSPYGNFTVQHPDQLNQNNNGNLSDQRDRFSDSNRVGSESHLGGLFSAGSHSPVTSQHYDNSSLGSTYDTDTRAFPSQLGGSGSSSANNRTSSSIFLRNGLDSPQVLPHSSSPLLFQSNSIGTGNKLKPQQPVESPTAAGPKYGNFFRPGLHELESPSPSGSVPFSNQVLPSPKFDASKYIQ